MVLSAIVAWLAFGLRLDPMYGLAIFLCGCSLLAYYYPSKKASENKEDAADGSTDRLMSSCEDDEDGGESFESDFPEPGDLGDLEMATCQQYHSPLRASR